MVKNRQGPPPYYFEGVMICCISHFLKIDSIVLKKKKNVQVHAWCHAGWRGWWQSLKWTETTDNYNRGI